MTTPTPTPDAQTFNAWVAGLERRPGRATLGQWLDEDEFDLDEFIGPIGQYNPYRVLTEIRGKGGEIGDVHLEAATSDDRITLPEFDHQYAPYYDESDVSAEFTYHDSDIEAIAGARLLYTAFDEVTPFDLVYETPVGEVYVEDAFMITDFTVEADPSGPTTTIVVGLVGNPKYPDDEWGWRHRHRPSHAGVGRQ